MSGASPDRYVRDLAAEGAHWDAAIAQRLLMDEIPGSIDFRLFFTQFRCRRGWQPPLLGSVEINFRRREIRHVIDAATRVPGARVLDLGCGAGWLSLELARQGAHVVGLDISPTNRALATYAAENNDRHFPYLYQRFVELPVRRAKFGSVEYVHADLNTVDLPVASFDAVVVWDSLHHVAQLERLLDQVHRALRPDGVFVGLDHATPMPRTIAFNREVEPLVADAWRWLHSASSPAAKEALIAFARSQDWGLLRIDDDQIPVPGADEFLERVRTDMLAIVRGGVDAATFERVAKTAATAHPWRQPAEAESSPFEDVSADRVMRVLLDRFLARRFTTVCPLLLERDVMPETEDAIERELQHYVSAVLIAMGEQAIARGRVTGQWFLFECSREAAPVGQADRLLEYHPDATETHINNLESLVQALRKDLHDKDVHIRNLDAMIQEQRPLLNRDRHKP